MGWDGMGGMAGLSEEQCWSDVHIQASPVVPSKCHCLPLPPLVPAAPTRTAPTTVLHHLSNCVLPPFKCPHCLSMLTVAYVQAGLARR